MRWIFALVLAIHGLIHFLGFAKAFGLAELAQLTQPVSRAAGQVWLGAGLLMLTTAALVLSGQRSQWIAGLLAMLLSQSVILSSWRDARFGTVANVIVLLGVAYGFAAHGPLSLRTRYEQQLHARREATGELPLVTEADLTALPHPVRRYLRFAGAIGRPRVHHFRASWRGRIRGAADEPWMEFTAEQQNSIAEPSRFFLMHATRSGLPVEVLHAFANGRASMDVRLLAAVPMVHAAGPELTRAETVTLLNDLCLLAPAALLDPRVRLQPIDENSARASLTLGADTVQAVLTFAGSGALIDFVSEDRLRAAADGTTFTRQRWSTPVRDYRAFGSACAMTHGDGRWHGADGEFVYIELELLDLEINGPR